MTAAWCGLPGEVRVSLLVGVGSQTVLSFTAQWMATV